MSKINFHTMRNLLFLLLFIMLTHLSFAQPYVYIDTDIKGMIQSEARWVDVNNDGFADLIITGERFSANKQIINTYLYINDKKGNFYKAKTDLLDYYRSCMDWADLNRDGYLDLMISGETSNHKIQTRVLRNSKWGNFSTHNPGIIGVRDGSLDIGDYNKDGKHDVAICGENNGTLHASIYKGVGSSYTNIQANLMPMYSGTIKWGDYDNDNDLDLLMCGEAADGLAYTKIYKNIDNNFVDLGVLMHGVKNGHALWGDFDNDGDLDIFICGEASNQYLLTRFYRNDGKDKFTMIKPPIIGARDGHVQAADYDCDGDLDLLISGETSSGPVVMIYRNEGKFIFTEVETSLPGVYLGGAYWSDYDGDCDNEVFLIGLDDCNNIIAKLYRNDMAAIAESPKKPFKPKNSLWMQSDVIVKEQPVYYYFVWASCFCNPEGKKEEDYHMYISNIHYLRKTYELQKRFNAIIIESIPNWGEVNGGHRVSIGYKTKAEAEAARRQVIRDYKNERFSINYVNW